MFLKSIQLNNVECFSDIDLSFESEDGDIRKWTLLLAENGMGKSTLLKAIVLVTGGSDAVADLLGEPSDWIRYKTQRGEISAVLVTTMILSEEHKQLLRKIEQELQEGRR